MNETAPRLPSLDGVRAVSILFVLFARAPRGDASAPARPVAKAASAS